MPIEQVQAGDQVWSYNHVAEQWELAVVKEQLINEQQTTTVLLEVTSGSEKGISTYIEQGEGVRKNYLGVRKSGFIHLTGSVNWICDATFHWVWWYC